MPRQPPRRGLTLLEEMEQMGEVRDWAPPGWHWEVLASGSRTLVRNPGPVVDPDILWWRSYGPRSFQREPAPPEEVAQRIEAEDQHVRRYMYALDNMYRTGWSVMRGSHVSYAPVVVPWLWGHTQRGSGPGRRPLGPGLRG
jgi:hypothetical protein